MLHAIFMAFLPMISVTTVFHLKDSLGGILYSEIVLWIIPGKNLSISSSYVIISTLMSLGNHFVQDIKTMHIENRPWISNFCQIGSDRMLGINLSGG
jgi:hypothetical protein